MRSAISSSRREFLRLAGGSCVYSRLRGFSPQSTSVPQARRKAVVVTFGGGARDDETFAPDGQENIPHLLHDLIPQATFFTQVLNEGILGHYVATASLITGTYEKFDNFAAVPPENPTVFEYFRKDLNRPASDAWVVAPSNGFNRIGESESRSYGPEFGAGVILPKRLLSAFLPSGSEREYQHLLRDNYESPFYSPQLSGNELDLGRIAEMLRLSVVDFAGHARSLTSPDELSVYIAKRLMREYAPSLLWITLHDIDVAHCGAFSLYIDGIKRSDRLCWEIWNEIQNNPEYSGKTAMFIMPDFGRDADDTLGGNGFQHHRTGDAASRTTWMIVIGPGIKQNMVVDRPVASTDLVPTLGVMYGFSPKLSLGKPLAEIL